MNPRHERPVALITGAGKRVGAVIARTLHAAGYDLALHYRHSAAEAELLAASLERQRSGSTFAVQAELADLDGLPAMVQRVVDRFGRLDALINNASAFYPTPVGTATPAQWNELFASNAQAPFFIAQAAAPALREARGAIVNMVDIYAERPLANHPLYCMAKAALEAMTRSLALDLGPDVRVNGVAPGAVLWPSDGKPYDDQQAMLARTPLRRVGSPEDIADAVLWLLRDAPFVTGQIIRVDGGRTLSV
ncbi:pteridine reductase [Dyella jiangningensis]|uniref:pteridine reductase n=1 Tax=Dyella sp. AtDHG13 TaxID=1938897 RepID=UPI000885D081|nr:pteridine reductase [Dyella sp. AtDHG13]PXV59487.1 pteridine reductase [Dyella sp. AtDHG13]SDJ16179.1 pteridine reductase [Dyella jiangningensis]